MQMGATIEDTYSKKVTHIFAADLNSLRKKVDAQSLKRFRGVSVQFIAKISSTSNLCRVIIG